MITKEIIRADREGRAYEVQKLSRRLSGKVSGPRNRRFTGLRSHNPDAETWTEFLAKSPAEGGCEAKTVNYEEEWKNSTEDSSVEYAPDHQQYEYQANDDVKRIRRHVVRASKRRAVPEHLLPIEVWTMLLLPNYRMEKTNRRVTVGRSERERTKICNSTFFNVFTFILAKIRRSQQTVLIWNKAQAAQLQTNVRYEQHACKMVRLVFIFDPIGCAYFAAMIARNKKKEKIQYPDSAHGCVPQRRRESAFITARCSAYRLVLEHDVAAITTLDDQSNAYMSMNNKMATTGVQQVTLKEGQELAQPRVNYACFILTTPTGKICFHANSGCLPGDPLVVALWLLCGCSGTHTTTYWRQQHFAKEKLTQATRSTWTTCAKCSQYQPKL